MKYLSIIILIVFSGCSYALRVSVPEFEKEIRVIAEKPEIYKIRVIGDETIDYGISPEGIATIQVPETPRACDHILFGINLGGSGAPRIYIMKNYKKITELSPLTLYEHPNGKGDLFELKME